MVRNTYIYPPAPSMRIISDIFSYTAEHMPRFNSISISGYHMQEAGATADLELAYTLADGVEYLRAGLDAGPRHRPVRAAAELLLGDRHELLHGGRQAPRGPGAVGAAGARVRPAEPQVAQPAHALPDQRLVADRAGRLQQRRPHLHRGDGRHPGPHPVACTPTPSTRRSRCRPTSRARIARNTQLLLQQESGTTGTIDPWAGSYYVERLTHDLAERAWAHIQEAEQAGGMAKAIEQGIPKMRIEEAAARTQARIDSGAQAVIGVNTYRLADEDPLDVLRVDNDDVYRQQIAKLERLRAERDDDDVRRVARGADRSAEARRQGRTATCSRWPSTRPGPRRRSARSPTRWRRSTAGTRP